MNIEIQEDLDGWSVVVPRLEIQSAWLGMGASTVFLGTWSFSRGWTMLGQMTGPGVAMMVIGLFAVLMPLHFLSTAFQRTLIEVSWRSVRIQRQWLGIPILRREVPLEACRAVHREPYALHLGELVVPTIDSAQLDLVVRKIRDGARRSAAEQVPPVPEALADLRT